MKLRNGLVIGVSALMLVIGVVLVKRALERTAVSTNPSASATAAAGPAQSESRRILYYRNGMGLADASPTPKKDSMGMSYVPVYADEQSAANTVRIGTEKMQKLGVRTEMVEKRTLIETLRVVGTIQYDERRQYALAPKFEGWITRLFVSTTGAPVRRGQPLLAVYSPDLISAQQDYRVAAKALQELAGGDAGARESMQTLMQGSLERLQNWDIRETELAALRSGAAPLKTMVLRAQHDGVVTEKAARVGLRFMPGDPLYQIADLSTVWMVGSVFEQDLARVTVGTPVTATVVALPGTTFKGTISFVDPVLQADTRSAQVRIELANPRGLLKPAMYASVEMSVGPSNARLAVPNSAILDSGTRQLVLVDRGGGEFEPLTVQLGVKADGYTEILEGLAEHEAVVVNGNFLIDSESNLRAAIVGLGAPARDGKTAAPESGPGSAVPAQPSAHPEHH
jgi:membrane fusion protein, copper/silver efflux system